MKVKRTYKGKDGKPIEVEWTFERPWAETVAIAIGHFLVNPAIWGVILVIWLTAMACAG